MTPQEKAIELVEKFDELLTYLESKSKAKDCALIAVDEIVQAIRFTDAKSDLGYVGYWQEVKKEIEKL
jgi:hypothetical protein